MMPDNAEVYAARYAAGQAVLRYPAEWVVRANERGVFGPAGQALDYGAGSGANAAALRAAGWTVQALDPAPVPGQGVGPIAADATTLPCRSGALDLVLANQVLYYLETRDQLVAIIAECRRVLKPTGLLAFSWLGGSNVYHTQGALRPDGRLDVVARDGRIEVLWPAGAWLSLLPGWTYTCGFTASEFPGKGNNHHALVFARPIAV